MKRVNYHTHTSYCRHAGGSVAEYAAEARKKDLEILGFSDHIPYEGNPYAYRMQYEELEPYHRDVLAEKERYQGQMTIVYGFEAEYTKGREKYYEYLYHSGQCQYLIMGQHWFFDEDGREWQSGSVPSTEYYPAYARQVMEGMKTGFFQIVAHPDIIFMNRHGWDDNCERTCDLIVEDAVKRGYILEYNANGYRRGIKEFEDGERYQYPHRKLWEKVAQTHIPVLVGSDCHQPGQMYDESVEKAYRDAQNLNLNIITDFL